MKRNVFCTVWNSDIDLDDWSDWRKELEAEGETLSDSEFYERVAETNSNYLDDERINLNIELPEEIICIADLGLWNGRRMGYKVIGSNIANCLYSSGDTEDHWFVDTNGDLCCTSGHHDGTNFITYRMFKEGLSEVQKCNFCDKIYRNEVTSKDITRYTKALGPDIAKVYGFKCPGKRAS